MTGESIVLLSAGEASTICSFLGSFLDRACRAALQNCTEQVEVVRSGDLLDHVEKKGERGVLIRAAQLPYGLRLRANLAQTSWPEDAPSACGLVLFLVQFPYESRPQVRGPFDRVQQNLLDHLQAGQLHLPQYRMVFVVNRNRRFGATDSVKEEETLAQLPDQIRQAEEREYPERRFLLPLMDYCTYRSDEDLVRVLYRNPRVQMLVTAAFRQQFMEWSNRLSSEFFRQDLEYEYKTLCWEEIETLKSNDATHTVMNFTRMPRRRPVWQTWTESYHRKYFDTIVRLANLLYSGAGHIGDICFWNRAADEKALRALLERRFREHFSAQERSKNFQCPSTQAEYENQRVETKLDIEFMRAINSFVDEQIPECVHRHLDARKKALAAIV